MAIFLFGVCRFVSIPGEPGLNKSDHTENFMKNFSWLGMTQYDRKLATAIFLVVITALIHSLSSFAFADDQIAPANDSFANAQVISGPNGSVFASNVDATKQANEPAHGENKGGKSIWYRYDSTSTGVLTINTIASAFDTTLAVYDGTSLTNLELIASNDDIQENGTNSPRSRVRIGISPGKSYYIAVDGYNFGSTTVSGSVVLGYDISNAPVNDDFADAIVLSGEKGRMHSATNVGATKELGEPNHHGNPGGKSIWYKWTAPAGMQRSYAFEVRSTSITLTGGSFTMLNVYTGSALNSLTSKQSNGRQVYNKIVFRPVPGQTYYFAVDGNDGGDGAQMGSFVISYRPTKSVREANYDNDGSADLAVFRPTTGTWYSLDSSSNQMRARRYGTVGDSPFIIDPSPDGHQDATVYRPDTGTWYVQGYNGLSNIFPFGTQTDIPLVRMFQQQISYQAVVFRPSEGTWWMRNFNGSADVIQWGQNGDIPMFADFDGNGDEDLVIFRPSTGVWYIKDITNNIQHEIPFGQNGDRPLPADYDGDGKADAAIYRPSTGEWWIRRSSDSAVTSTAFGIASDIPQPADYDGDAKDDIAIYRNGVWWILQSSNGVAKSVPFGLPDDIPISSPFN